MKRAAVAASNAMPRSAAPHACRAALLLFVTLTAGTCASAGSAPGQDPFAGGADAAEIRIRVRNQNFYDATLTAVSDTGNRRMGSVGGNQTAVFSLPWSFTSGLRIEIDLLAGPTCLSDYIVVNPGETVTLVIEPDVDRTFVCR